MENDHSLNSLANLFEKNASVRNLFGEPIIARDKTLVPVAKIAYGLDGGTAPKKLKGIGASLSPAETPSDVENSAGAGGGMYAYPLGVYEISDRGTRFIPANSLKKVLLGVAIGILLKAWISRKIR